MPQTILNILADRSQFNAENICYHLRMQFSETIVLLLIVDIYKSVFTIKSIVL